MLPQPTPRCHEAFPLKIFDFASFEMLMGPCRVPRRRHSRQFTLRHLTLAPRGRRRPFQEFTLFHRRRRICHVAPSQMRPLPLGAGDGAMRCLIILAGTSLPARPLPRYLPALSPSPASEAHRLRSRVLERVTDFAAADAIYFALPRDGDSLMRDADADTLPPHRPSLTCFYANEANACPICRHHRHRRALIFTAR